VLEGQIVAHGLAGRLGGWIARSEVVAGTLAHHGLDVGTPPFIGLGTVGQAANRGFPGPQEGIETWVQRWIGEASTRNKLTPQSSMDGSSEERKGRGADESWADVVGPG
jgi:hypothetical protein